MGYLPFRRIMRRSKSEKDEDCRSGKISTKNKGITVNELEGDTLGWQGHTNTYVKREFFLCCASHI